MATVRRLHKPMPLAGLYTAKPPDSLEPVYSPRAVNVHFKFGEIRERPGSDLLAGPMATEPVLWLGEFELASGTIWPLALTETGLYRLGRDVPLDVLEWHRVPGPTLLGTRRFSVTAGEGQFFFTRGDTNKIYRWNGLPTTPYDEIPASAGTVPVARHVEYFAHRLVSANLDNQPARLQWAANLDHTDWDDTADTGAGFLDFYEEQAKPFTGLRALHNQLVAYKLNAIIELTHTGSLTPIFSSEVRVRGLGLGAPYTLCSSGTAHFFLANDFNVYRYDGITPVSIGDPILDELEALLDSANLDQYFAVLLPTRKEYWLCLDADNVFVYDYRQNTWTRDTFPDITAIAELTEGQAAATWTSIATAWDTDTRRWFGLNRTGRSVVYAGRSDGASFKIDEGVASDYFTEGSIIDRVVETPDFYWPDAEGVPDATTMGTLQRIFVLYDGGTTNTEPFEVGASCDRGRTWQTQMVTPNAEGHNWVDIIKTGPTVRYRFRERNANGRFRWRRYVYEFVPVEQVGT